METVLLNQAELDDCVHSTSIRSTCRKVLRKVFKEELRDPNIHFAHILQKEGVVTAIRGQSNNLGARFFDTVLCRFRPYDASVGELEVYRRRLGQRDRVIKIRAAGMNTENEKETQSRTFKNEVSSEGECEGYLISTVAG